MNTYVIQDFIGLFHIIQSEKDFKEVWKEWLFSNDGLQKYAIDIADLRETLESMGVENITFYSCREEK